MAPERDSLDISHNPELLRVADEDVAVVMPVADRPGRRGKRSKTEADYQAFLASAGSWADVDIDEFQRYLRGRRDAGDRPPVEL